MSNGITSPGNVAVHHGRCNTKLIEKRLKFAELMLRVLILGLALIATLLIVSDSQVRVIFSITKKAQYTDMKSLVFLVVANVIVSTYSVLQIVRCVVGLIRGSVLFSKPLAWLIFSGDQMMAYLTLAAVSVAMQSSMIGQFGQSELQWMKICNLYKKYCTQTGEGLASAVMVSLFTIILSCISAYSLFRLYGGKTGKARSIW